MYMIIYEGVLWMFGMRGCFVPDGCQVSRCFSTFLKHVYETDVDGRTSLRIITFNDESRC